MIFYRYGVQLHKLEQRHIETVRRWRNNDFVRSRMHDSKMITPEEQSIWFMHLNERNDWYFISSFDDHPFGVFHIKNINRSKRSGEVGAFVNDPQFVGHAASAFAILALMDFGFFALGLSCLEAKYHPAFKEIDSLNKQLGYEVYQLETNGFVRARLQRETYLEKAVVLRKNAEKLQGNETWIIDAGAWLEERVKKEKQHHPFHIDLKR